MKKIGEEDREVARPARATSHGRATCAEVAWLAHATCVEVARSDHA